MRKLKVHKMACEYYYGQMLSKCGLVSWNCIKVHRAWKYVTCRNCLRKRDNK